MTLAQFLKLHALTQREFGNRIGVTQGRVSHLLNGETPSWKLAARIKRATGGAVMPNDWLQNRSGAQNRSMRKAG